MLFVAINSEQQIGHEARKDLKSSLRITRNSSFVITDFAQLSDDGHFDKHFLRLSGPPIKHLIDSILHRVASSKTDGETFSLALPLMSQSANTIVNFPIQGSKNRS